MQERAGVFLQQAASVAGPRRVASGGSAAGRLATSVRLPLPASETAKGDGQLLGGLPAGSGAQGGRGE